MAKAKSKTLLSQHSSEIQGMNDILWKGPLEDGITYSLLSDYLSCKERFRLKTVEGLRPQDTFNAPMEYGTMWHACEEGFADAGDWKTPLETYVKECCNRYRYQQDQVIHWYNVCLVQFPLYIKFWEGHKDMKARTPLLQEHSFRVNYPLPSGRCVTLRGKWDSTDLVGKTQIYLQENKTKGKVDEEELKASLKSGFDLQPMLYLTSLSHELESTGTLPGVKSVGRGKLAGIRYNVVRRPLSGGKGSIVRHKPNKKNPTGETADHFYNRLRDIISEDPSHFFMRWNVEVESEGIESFRRRVLDPILENLCDDYEWWVHCFEMGNSLYDASHRLARFNHYPRHYIHPYGVWNPMDHGRPGELDNYLVNGDRTGLVRATTLFPEL